MSKRNDERLSTREYIMVCIICVVIILAAFMVGKNFMQNRPRSKRKKPVVSIPLVQIVHPKRTDHQVILNLMGSIIAAQETDLKPLVAGRIVSFHPSFIEGGIVSKGEILVTLDSNEYELVLTTKLARVAQAKYELKLEKSQQDIARHEWNIIKRRGGFSKFDREMALRVPHLENKIAQLKAAEAEVEKTRLAIERTKIYTPFDAIIQSVNVHVGDMVSSQTALAKLVGTYAYHVKTAIPMNQLQWINVNVTRSESYSSARVKTTTGKIREGKVIKLMSDLEPNGRLARVLIEIKNPLNLNSPDSEPLMIGEYVNVEIIGKTLENVYLIPNNLIRDGNKVWTVGSKGRLRYKKIKVVRRNREYAVISNLRSYMKIVKTNIATPVKGMKLRIENGHKRRKKVYYDKKKGRKKQIKKQP